MKARLYKPLNGEVSVLVEEDNGRRMRMTLNEYNARYGTHVCPPAAGFDLTNLTDRDL